MVGMIQRTLSFAIDEILMDFGKMAFISGPRQVGKSTLSHAYAEKFGRNVFLNWDAIDDRKLLLREPYFFQQVNRNPKKPLLVLFDEIHKWPKWKAYLKGVFDKFHADFRFLITGSGRLDIYKKGGDSLMGRYFGLPLFPLTLGELGKHFPRYEEFKANLEEPGQGKNLGKLYSELFEFGGFPEPLSRGKKSFYKRWSEERKKLLVREDARDISNLRQIANLENLSHLLPERVGSPLSVNSLREDIGAAFESIRDWILLLESLFYAFSIKPFSRSIARSLKKEKKVYLYDWAEIVEKGPRFENLVALSLYKATRTWRSLGEGDLDLFYLRDKEKREVDFAIVDGKTPILLVECKLTDSDPAKHLLYFQEKLKIKTVIQLVSTNGVYKKILTASGVCWVISADRFLGILP